MRNIIFPLFLLFLSGCFSNPTVYKKVACAGLIPLGGVIVGSNSYKVELGDNTTVKSFTEDKLSLGVGDCIFIYPPVQPAPPSSANNKFLTVNGTGINGNFVSIQGLFYTINNAPLRYETGIDGAFTCDLSDTLFFYFNTTYIGSHSCVETLVLTDLGGFTFGNDTVRNFYYNNLMALMIENGVMSIDGRLVLDSPIAVVSSSVSTGLSRIRLSIFSSEIVKIPHDLPNVYSVIERHNKECGGPFRYCAKYVIDKDTSRNSDSQTEGVTRQESNDIRVVANSQFDNTTYQGQSTTADIIEAGRLKIEAMKIKRRAVRTARELSNRPAFTALIGLLTSNYIQDFTLITTADNGAIIDGNITNRKYCPNGLVGFTFKLSNEKNLLWHDQMDTDCSLDDESVCVEKADKYKDTNISFTVQKRANDVSYTEELLSSDKKDRFLWAAGVNEYLLHYQSTWGKKYFWKGILALRPSGGFTKMSAIVAYDILSGEGGSFIAHCEYEFGYITN
jgi:hypothetical protein